MRGYRRLTHDVAAFDVDLDGPLDFEAGQFALVTVPGIAGARAYSMVNFERGAKRLSFVVKKKPGGAVSEWLFGDARRGRAPRPLRADGPRHVRARACPGTCSASRGAAASPA